MEIQTARKWYRWLWLSPFLTIPTLVIVYMLCQPIGQQIICPQGWSNCNYEAVESLTELIAVGVSSLWHLVLLIPATNKQYPFVMWHGRQTLLLALLRTSVPIFFVLFARDPIIVLLSLLLLIPIWLVGNLWGQNQAGRGDCSLMHWTGRADSLPGPPEEKESDAPDGISADALETTFRFSNDPHERQAALEELKKRGLVEYL